MKRQLLILASVVGAGMLGAAYFSFVVSAVEGEWAMPSMGILLGGLALLIPGLWMDGVLSVLLVAARRTLRDLPALAPYILVLGGGGHLDQREYRIRRKLPSQFRLHFCLGSGRYGNGLRPRTRCSVCDGCCLREW